MKKPIIGIVGGSGFIGSRIASRLQKRYVVRVLDKRPYSEHATDSSVQYRMCDITRYEDVRQGLEDIAVVIHTAIVQIPLINENKELGYNVNFIGTQNVCKAISENPSIKGMVLAGSWHVMGESRLEGIIDEDFGFRPDKVEDRAYLYALSKIAQEIIVRFYDQMIPDSVFGVIRLGTVLGEGMPEKTAANIFISKGLKGEAITPYKHTMYRPMLYVGIEDVCKAFEIYVEKILRDEIKKNGKGTANIVNLCWPTPVTILELAKIVKEEIVNLTRGKINPKIEIIDQNLPMLHDLEDAKRLRIDIRKAEELLGLKNLKSPRESIARIISNRLKKI